MLPDHVAQHPTQGVPETFRARSQHSLKEGPGEHYCGGMRCSEAGLTGQSPGERVLGLGAH